MAACDCGALAAGPFRRVDEALTGKAAKAVRERSTELVLDRSKFMKLFRCDACGQLWAEACWASGQMMIFYLYPVPPTDDPAGWLRDEGYELWPPARPTKGPPRLRDAPGPRKRRRRSRPKTPRSEESPAVPPPAAIPEGENIPVTPEVRVRGWARVPDLTPVVEMRRPPMIEMPGASGIRYLQKPSISGFGFAPGGKHFAFSVFRAFVAVADVDLGRVVTFERHDLNSPARTFGFDETGEVLAIGAGTFRQFRDVDDEPVPIGCRVRAWDIETGALVEEIPADLPVSTLPERYRHGDFAPADATRHRGPGGVVVRWHRDPNVLVSVHRGRRQTAELFFETIIEAPPRIDPERGLAWAFAHGRTTVYAIDEGHLVHHGRSRDVPKDLRPPRRAPSREMRLPLNRDVAIETLGPYTVRATATGVALYRGETPWARASGRGQGAGLSRDEKWLIVGGPRDYRLFDLSTGLA